MSEDGEQVLREAMDQLQGKEEAGIEFEPTMEEMLEEPTEEAVEEPTEEVAEKPEPKRSEFVETDDPKIQARINDLYKQVKGSDETNAVLRQENQRLADALDAVNQRLDGVAEKQTQAETNANINQLKAQLREARDLGDDDLVDRIQDQLDDVRLEAKLATQPKPEAPVQQQNYSQAEVQYMNAIAAETNTDGSLKRPWLQDNVQMQQAINIGAKLANEHYLRTGTPMSLPDMIAGS